MTDFKQALLALEGEEVAAQWTKIKAKEDKENELLEKDILANDMSPEFKQRIPFCLIGNTISFEPGTWQANTKLESIGYTNIYEYRVWVPMERNWWQRLTNKGVVYHFTARSLARALRELGKL